MVFGCFGAVFLLENQTLRRKINDPNKRSSLYFSVSEKKRVQSTDKVHTKLAEYRPNKRRFVYTLYVH